MERVDGIDLTANLFRGNMRPQFYVKQFVNAGNVPGICPLVIVAEFHAKEFFPSEAAGIGQVSNDTRHNKGNGAVIDKATTLNSLKIHSEIDKASCRERVCKKV